VLPTDPNAIKLFKNPAALLFFDHWQHKVFEEELRRFGTMLGVYWDRDNAEMLFDDGSNDRESASVPEKAMFPLAFILKPEFRDVIKNMFGRRFGRDAPTWAKEQKEEVVDMWKLSKEDFKAIYSGNIATVAPKVK